MSVIVSRCDCLSGTASARLRRGACPGHIISATLFRTDCASPTVVVTWCRCDRFGAAIEVRSFR
eukprot:5816635-Pyramimonas_sp.AAC.1